VFKTHIGELCKSLVDQAPSERHSNDPSVVDVLKACASYARKFPEEISQEKSFSQALINYASFGTPPKAAKHAINIMLARKDDKGLVNATSLLQRIMKNWKYEAPNFLTKLAAVSQLELLAPKVTIDYDQDILNMTVQKVLLQVRTDAKPSDPAWVEDADLDDEIQAKHMCLKILVNRLRAEEDAEEAKKKAQAVLNMFRTLISKDGEMCKVKDTPRHHRSRLVLLAAQLTLKLCTIQHLDDLLTPRDFNMLAYVSQRSEAAVRHRFVEKLEKYLVQGKLRARFYTIIFLTAFEPNVPLKQRTETWIRSRTGMLAKAGKQTMEAIAPRLISLLAHHPDYSADAENLIDHAKYFLYFVSNVATEANLGLITRYTERVKQTRDAINGNKSENIYVLCDLMSAVLRKYQEKKGWSFQAYNGKTGLPVGLFSPLQGHDAAQKIAEENYLPEGVEEKLDVLFRSVDKKKVRFNS
jgi:sister-chromatid-cohesion protein PDS5